MHACMQTWQIGLSYQEPPRVTRDRASPSTGCRVSSISTTLPVNAKTTIPNADGTTQKTRAFEPMENIKKLPRLTGFPNCIKTKQGRLQDKRGPCPHLSRLWAQRARGSPKPEARPPEGPALLAAMLPHKGRGSAWPGPARVSTPRPARKPGPRPRASASAGRDGAKGAP